MRKIEPRDEVRLASKRVVRRVKNWDSWLVGGDVSQ